MHARLRNTRNSTRTYAFAKCTLAPRLQSLLLQADFVPAEACSKAAMTMRLAELVRTVDSLVFNVAVDIFAYCALLK